MLIVGFSISIRLPCRKSLTPQPVINVNTSFYPKISLTFVKSNYGVAYLPTPTPCSPKTGKERTYLLCCVKPFHQFYHRSSSTMPIHFSRRSYLLHKIESCQRSGRKGHFEPMNENMTNIFHHPARDHKFLLGSPHYNVHSG